MRTLMVAPNKVYSLENAKIGLLISLKNSRPKNIYKRDGGKSCENICSTKNDWQNCKEHMRFGSVFQNI